MINANDYRSFTDSETLENALCNIRPDGILVIPPRESDIEPERDWWLIDRAILLPANTTVILQNCKIKLSDKCRDNFFRTANCGLGIEDIDEISNVHIRGEGLCILEGADHPRATGDSEKIIANPCAYTVEDLCRLGHWIPEEHRTPEKITFGERHSHSFGTDTGKENESQFGDWRGIGILFANCTNFSVSNLKIVCTHGWGISLEACSHGRVDKIEFDSCMSKEIDGMLHNMENQDGLDIRNGCHHIIISDITGRTGDDVIALTAIAVDEEYRPSGSLCTTHVMHNDWSRRDRHIHDIIIRNVIAYSSLCYTIRLLPGNADIWNIVIDGVIDTSEGKYSDYGAVMVLGNKNPAWGFGEGKFMRNIIISNVISNSKVCFDLCANLTDSAISNVVCYDSEKPLFIRDPDAELINVKTSGITSGNLFRTK